MLVPYYNTNTNNYYYIFLSCGDGELDGSWGISLQFKSHPYKSLAQGDFGTWTGEGEDHQPPGWWTTLSPS